MLILRYLTGVLSTLLFSVSLILAVIPLVLLALVKFLLPHKLRRHLNPWLDGIASAWVTFNSFHQRWLTGTRIDVEGDLNLRREEWYLLVANHQSWVDILVLLRVLNGHIPAFKFFIKKQLIWMPFLGAGCWALEFPFMRRYRREEVARNPALRGLDILETRTACEKYRDNPVTIFSFTEGTRFTPVKHARQNSVYKHLLMPRAGGLAFTLAAMNGQLKCLLDATIHYPEGRPTYWDYVCRRVGRVQLHLRQLPIPDDLIGDYAQDPTFCAHFQEWLNRLWQEKDARLEQMAQQSSDT
jgi:1-acyl-sn-glycerol-3-phosphate acyltransferase